VDEFDLEGVEEALIGALYLRGELASCLRDRTPSPPAMSRSEVSAKPREDQFAGSGGGQHWAVIASLIETCKLNGVQPHT
jgi:hypothetical protein